MRYQIKPIHCRPWTLSGLSLKLIESHYENNYGGAMRRLNAIAEQLESLDFAKTPGYVVNGLKRAEGVDGHLDHGPLAGLEALAIDFGRRAFCGPPLHSPEHIYSISRITA